MPEVTNGSDSLQLNSSGLQGFRQFLGFVAGDMDIFPTERRLMVALKRLSNIAKRKKRLIEIRLGN
jgi:hypothetical protein